VRLKSFQDMIDAIGAYGPNLPTPSYHEISVPLLNKEGSTLRSCCKIINCNGANMVVLLCHMHGLTKSNNV